MRRLLSGLVMLICAAAVQAQGGRLEQIRDAVESRDNDKPSKDKSSDKSDDDDWRWSPSFMNGTVNGSQDVSEGEHRGDLLASLILVPWLSPYILPHVILEDSYSRSGYFPRFPYAEDRPGYLRFPAVEGDEPGPLSPFSTRLSVEYGSDFDGIQRAGARMLLDTTSRFGIEASYDHLDERLPCGCHDMFDLGSANFTYRFAQSQHVQMYSGLGFNWLDDGFKTHYGFNFIYGADIFPVKPVIASLSIEAGTLEDAGLFRARGTVGVNWQSFEGFIGYDYLNIGGVDLQGPLAGFRFWY